MPENWSTYLVAGALLGLMLVTAIIQVWVMLTDEVE